MADWFDEQGAPGGPPPAPSGGGDDDWFAQQGGAGSAPPSAPSGPAGGGAPNPRADPYAIMRQAAQGLPPTAQSLDTIVEALRAQGIPAAKATHANNTLASDDVIILPDGTEVDAISDVNGPGAKWREFGPTGQYDPSRSVVGPGGALVNFGDYLQQQGRSVPMMAPNADQYDVGYSDRLGYGDWKMDPGYQFQLQEGAKALEHAAAAKGTLLTGGTLKGLARYAQDYASGAFQNRYSRLFGEQQNRYNQLAGLAGLGANAAAQQGNANTGYAGGASDLLTQQGNAAAAGTVGGATAMNNAIAQGSQTALQMYYLSRLYGGGSGGGAGGTGGGYGGPTYVGNTGPGGPVTRP